MAQKYSFLVVKYPRTETADHALRVLKELAQDKVIKLRDAVAITKTEKGKIKLHQTKDDSPGKGVVKGGVIGVLFALLFGPAGWIAIGAATGGVFAGFDRGIRNKLLKELGQNLTPDESAVALLIEHADWPAAFDRMKSYGFGGQVVVSEIVAEDVAEVEALIADRKPAEEVPEELEIPAPVEEVPAPAAEVLAGTTLMRITEIEGLSPAYAEKFVAVGIKSTDDLLTAGKDRAARSQLAETTGIQEELIITWVHDADLMRIPGVGPQYSDLLVTAGVESPAELAHRNAKNLESTVQSVAAERPGIVSRIPGESEIAGWISEAAKLEKVVEA